MDQVVVTVATNRPQMYKRSASSVWVAIPRCSRRSLSQFMSIGTWFAIRTELGEIITRK
jgi:hypothetical protein